MQTIQVGKLKADFSSVLEDIKNNGEKYIIEYGRSHKRVAMLVPYEEENKAREFGILQDEFIVPVDFNEETQEVNDLFYPT